jgi:lipopolysaccharide biosynthesis glycosyltransferase
MTIVFTICSNNYLAQAITLGHSLLKHNPEYIFKIGLVDRRNPGVNYSAIPFEIIEVEEIGITEFDEMFKRYSITELNTAVKPFYFKFFFNSIPETDNIIYLDPDILVYNPFIELEKVLMLNEIVITPHFTIPIDDDKFQAENDFLNAGVYNLGFIALKRGEESQKLITWWARRLETKAYIDFSRGLFTDQLWINFVPLFFNKVYILCHPGYNMAYWNLHERKLSDKGEVVKNNISYSLVFFHFSGFDVLIPDVLSKYQDRFTFEDRADIVVLFRNYSEKIIENGYDKFIRIQCSFAVKKQKLDLEAYRAFKKTIPAYKRILRGIILRFVRLFRVNIDYYTN